MCVETVVKLVPGLDYFQFNLKIRFAYINDSITLFRS